MTVKIDDEIIYQSKTEELNREELYSELKEKLRTSLQEFENFLRSKKMDMEKYLNNIDNAVTKSIEKKVTEQNTIENEIAELTKQISDMQEKICNCIQLGDYCLQKGVYLTTGDLLRSKYSDKDFTADAWIHKVGFFIAGDYWHYYFGGRVDSIGIDDCCSGIDIHVYKDGTVSFSDSNSKKKRDALKEFVTKFETFEKEFLNYLENPKTI